MTQELPLFLLFAQAFKAEALSITHNIFAEGQVFIANREVVGER